MAEPFYWEERGAWYVNVTKPDGKRGRVKLHEVKRKAFELWKAMEANATGLDPEVAYIADKWIADLAGRVASGTLTADYHTYSQTVVTKYLNAHPHQKWSAFTATAVSSYCGKQGWSADHTATVMGRLKQMSKWAMELHKLPHNLSSLKKPKTKPREYYCTREDYAALIEATMTTKYFFKDFALLLAALWHTGARPGELISATMDDYRDGVLTLTEWKNARKTGKKRSIYLNRAAQVCVSKAIGNRTSGNLFVGKGGVPYNRDMIRNRIKRLRELAKLSDELTAYTIRHGYAVRALTQNLPIATLAELMGTSVSEIERTYGHLTKQHDHLRAAANGVR